MESIKNALIFLFDIVYPKQCAICGKTGKDILCDKCYNNEIYIKIQNECRIDKYKDKSFKEHIYLFKYNGIIRDLLLDYKFNDKSYLCDFFLKIILKNEKICRKIKKYDIMIPVPIHKKRKKQRGYDQSLLIARKIVKSFEKLELITDCLIKQKHTLQQSLLTKEERKQNVNKVYKIQNKEKIYNKRIVLFDDIYTTGSTANECARLLKESGAKEILVFTLAKD